jgi:protoporphyrinogen oxidase
MNSSADTDVLIIGAGLSGLTAAKVLKAAGRKIKLLEASDGIGGRVRTDIVDGFLLDRGFQVLLTAYPETKRFLNYKALDLKVFEPGAIILTENGTTEIGDPLRRPSILFKTLFSSAGSLSDKIRMLRLKLKLNKADIEEIFSRKEISTLAYLVKQRFSDRMIHQFFKPFMTGIFLEDKLDTSSRMFEFVFKMFSEGDTAIPAKGMGMIPAQLAEGLSTEELILNETVVAIEGNNVITASKRNYQAQKILIATDGASIPAPFAKNKKKPNSVTNIYFSADKAPFEKPIIALNSMNNKLVNNIAVMEKISRDYAPPGKSLISVSLIGDFKNSLRADLPFEAIQELKYWFPDAADWNHLKTYHIPYGLPNDVNVNNELTSSAFRLSDNCFTTGDYLLNGSINAAMKSGRQAAEMLISLTGSHE